MTISVKDLKLGDSFIHERSGLIYKVIEIFEKPVFRFPDFKEVYPIICECVDSSSGEKVGFRKLEDEIEQVDLIENKCDES